MNLKLSGTLSGSVTPPPSKSQAHRLLICAALGDAPVVVRCSAVNDDILATMNCLNALGADIRYGNGFFSVLPLLLRKGAVLDCGESGSTLRFLLSVAAVLGADATFIGQGKLPQRPNDALRKVLLQHGVVSCSEQEGLELPMKCTGKLVPGEYRLPGNLSSQYLTGLLFALPLAQGDSVIKITDGLSSASYVDMTLDAIRAAGIVIERKGDDFIVKGGQNYSLPADVNVEGDWSSAAFWIVAGVIGKHPLTVQGMNLDSIQGDRKIVDHLRMMGAYVEAAEGGVVAVPSHLFGCEIDCEDTPDLLPILSVAAAVAEGDTTFLHVGRLRYKESDRLQAMQATLAAFGISSTIGEDTFTVHSAPIRQAAVVDSFGDHRIAMSAAILSTVSGGVASLNGAECVAKSYPGFFDDYRSLGARVEITGNHNTP